MASSTLSCATCGGENQARASFCRFCGHPLQANNLTLFDSATGRLLTNLLLKQRYRIIEPIGQGGFGAVYRAEDAQLGNRPVALKEMRQSGLSSQAQEKAALAFQQEAIMLARLQHPNLPSIFDHFEENQRWYLVMSFIEGESLDKYLSSKEGERLPLEEVVGIGGQLCNVLDYLHRQQPPIIFRDLKPANIMRTSDGHIYLIDFGIARHFKPGQTKDTSNYGSNGYAPPEQYGTTQTTSRSDIYSLGATLHQLLSGHDPSSTPFYFPPLQSLVPAVPANLATFITQMLEMDADQRPANVVLVKQELQKPASQVSQSTSQGEMTANSGNQPTSAFPSRLLLAKPEAIAVFRTFTDHTQDVLSLALSADGRILASLSLGQTMKLWNIQTGKLLPAPTLKIILTCIALSADGRILAIGLANKQITLWDVQAGQSLGTFPRKPTDQNTHGGAITSIALNADGRVLASGGASGSIMLWDTQANLAGDKTPAHLLNPYYTSPPHPPHIGSVTSLALSADGMILASGSRDQSFYVWDTLTRQHLCTPITDGKHKGVVTSVALNAEGQIAASGSLDETTKVWDVQQDKLRHTLKEATKSVALNANGQLLATAGYNSGAINLWRTQDGQLVRTLALDTASVSSVALSADGRIVAGGSFDGTIHIWGVKE